MNQQVCALARLPYRATLTCHCGDYIVAVVYDWLALVAWGADAAVYRSAPAGMSNALWRRARSMARRGSLPWRNTLSLFRATVAVRHSAIHQRRGGRMDLILIILIIVLLFGGGFGYRRYGYGGGIGIGGVLLIVLILYLLLGHGRV